MTVFDNFQTERLSVDIITTLGATAHANLDQVLTPSVTQFLPPDAQLAQFSGDIDAWLRYQQSQGATLMLASCDGVGVGLVMLHNGGGGEVMIGYMFAQSAWGKGYASELVLGLVAMLRSAGSRYAFGGVADQNPASARVLEKAGFEAISNQGEAKMYRLRVGGENA